MSGLMKHGMAKMHKQSYKLSGAQYAMSCILTEHHVTYLVYVPNNIKMLINMEIG